MWAHQRDRKGALHVCSAETSPWPSAPANRSPREPAYDFRDDDEDIDDNGGGVAADHDVELPTRQAHTEAVADYLAGAVGENGSTLRSQSGGAAQQAATGLSIMTGIATTPSTTEAGYIP